MTKKKTKWLCSILLMLLFLATGCQKKESSTLWLSPGWNLGNTLDAHGIGKGQPIEDYETYWGNPVTTEEMLATVAEAGFKSVRIPVSWYEHIDSKTGIIDPDWLYRVQKVLDAALRQNMYVVLNIHGDPWINLFPEKADNVEKMLTVVWGQIAAYFADYDNRLIFEGMNEPRLINADSEWTVGTQEARDVLNRLNKAFVNTIRNQGSEYNSERWLMITTYCGGIEEESLRSLRIPDDEHIMVAVHTYRPYRFAQASGGTNVWDARNLDDTQDLDTQIQLLNKYLVKKGVPTVITEFAAVNKSNERFRAAWADYVSQKTQQSGIAVFWWDTGGNENNSRKYTILDRYTLSWIYPKILDALIPDPEIQTGDEQAEIEIEITETSE